MNATAATPLPSDTPTDPSMPRPLEIDLARLPRRERFADFVPMTDVRGLEASLERARPSVLARAGARLLDALVAVAVGLPTALLGTWAALAPDLGSDVAAVLAIAPFAIAMTALGIYQIALLSTTGQTLGKKWVGLRVVGLEGEPVGFMRAFFLRELVWNVVSGMVPFLFLVDIIPAWFGQGRTLHDLLSRTRVIEL